MPEMQNITLYHGDNGAHEFYETASGTKPHLVIIRHHQSEAWFVLLARPAIREIPAGPLSAVIRDVAEATGHRIAIDPSLEFTEPRDAAENMVLREIDLQTEARIRALVEV